MAKPQTLEVFADHARHIERHGFVLLIVPGTECRVSKGDVVNMLYGQRQVNRSSGQYRTHKIDVGSVLIKLISRKPVQSLEWHECVSTGFRPRTPADLDRVSFGNIPEEWHREWQEYFNEHNGDIKWSDNPDCWVIELRMTHVKPK